MRFDLETHLARQREFSERTFGPGNRAAGVIDHIRKELFELEEKPGDLEEWIDVVILALDGAWRSGASPCQIVRALVAKQDKNESRRWPDWRKSSPDKAIEHERDPREKIPNTSPTCVWTEDDDGNWEASCCGRVFVFIDGGPVANKFIRCPYCGARLEEKGGAR